MERLLSEILEDKGRRVIDAAPETDILSAAKMMSSEGIGSLVVLEDGKLAGIMTERDILNRVVSEGRDPSEVAVGDIMTRDVVVLDPGCTVRQAMHVVTEKKMRHLPVLREGELVGMLSAGDLTRSVIQDEEEVIESLNQYIQTGGGYGA